MVTTIDHAETSRRLIQQADEELAKGDLLQASEKGWGAAAHAMKGIARSRGWPHSHHRELFAVADRLVAETSQQQIRTLFQVASATHKNFYEGWLTAEAAAGNLADIRTLLEILDILSAKESEVTPC